MDGDEHDRDRGAPRRLSALPGRARRASARWRRPWAIRSNHCPRACGRASPAASPSVTTERHRLCPCSSAMRRTAQRRNLSLPRPRPPRRAPSLAGARRHWSACSSPWPPRPWPSSWASDLVHANHQVSNLQHAVGTSARTVRGGAGHARPQGGQRAESRATASWPSSWWCPTAGAIWSRPACPRCVRRDLPAVGRRRRPADLARACWAQSPDAGHLHLGRIAMPRSSASPSNPPAARWSPTGPIVATGTGLTRGPVRFASHV